MKPPQPGIAFCFIASAIFLCVSCCFSQELPDQPKPHRKAFIALAVAGQATALADAACTIRAMRLGSIEDDPLARPIVNLPAPAYVATSSLLVAGVSALSLEMKKSRHFRKIWWIPQMIQIAVNGTMAARSISWQLKYSKPVQTAPATPASNPTVFYPE